MEPMYMIVIVALYHNCCTIPEMVWKILQNKSRNGFICLLFILPFSFHFSQTPQMQLQGAAAGHTMLQTISNPDGSLSIIQIDPGDAAHPQIVTLADGTQAQIVHAVNAAVSRDSYVMRFRERA